MKIILMCVAALASVCFSGCKPTTEQINKTATAIGYAAGLVANQTKIKDDARNVIVTILNDVRECVPAEGQSFADAWRPIIAVKVADLVEAGKIDAGTGEIVKSFANMAAQAVDYVFDVHFPKAKQYEELVRACVSGALDGFLSVFKPVNNGARAMVEYDKDAYEWFQKNRK
jgi:hypothetical protein